MLKNMPWKKAEEKEKKTEEKSGMGTGSQMILVICWNSPQLTDDTGDLLEQPSAHR